MNILKFKTREINHGSVNLTESIDKLRILTIGKYQFKVPYNFYTIYTNKGRRACYKKFNNYEFFNEFPADVINDDFNTKSVEGNISIYNLNPLLFNEKFYKEASLEFALNHTSKFDDLLFMGCSSMYIVFKKQSIKKFVVSYIEEDNTGLRYNVYTDLLYDIIERIKVIE